MFLTCNYLPDGNDRLVDVIAIIYQVVKLLQLFIPILLIVLGSIDIGKAVVSGDEKKIKENQSRFVKRIIAAVIVFLIPWIVSLLMSIIGSNEWKSCWHDAREKGWPQISTMEDNN